MEEAAESAREMQGLSPVRPHTTPCFLLHAMHSTTACATSQRVMHRPLTGHWPQWYAGALILPDLTVHARSAFVRDGVTECTALNVRHCMYVTACTTLSKATRMRRGTRSWSSSGRTIWRSGFGRASAWLRSSRSSMRHSPRLVMHAMSSILCHALSSSQCQSHLNAALTLARWVLHPAC